MQFRAFGNDFDMFIGYLGVAVHCVGTGSRAIYIVVEKIFSLRS